MTQFHHREVLSEPAIALANRPRSGAISVLPESDGAPKEGSMTQAACAAVREAGGEVVPLSADTRGIVYTAYRNTEPLFAALAEYPQISWVQLPYAGIDVFAKRLIPFARRGGLVTSAKGAYAQPVAEHALALTLALQRNLALRARAHAWGPSMGLSLYGNNVVIVGAGGIALELLRLLEPFAVTTTVVRRTDTPIRGASHTVTVEQLDGVLPEADVVVLAAAATDETAGLMNAERFALMKSTAVLVNIGRGPLVDTNALVTALDRGQIYGAGLDVTDPEPLPQGHPLWQNERCLITPHSADTPEMTRPLWLRRVRDNVRAFLGAGEFVGIADPVRGY